MVRLLDANAAQIELNQAAHTWHCVDAELICFARWSNAWACDAFWCTGGGGAATSKAGYVTSTFLPQG